MKFKQWFLVEMLGDKEYKLPKDKEQQLYDFYMLSLIKDVSPKPNSAEFNNEDKVNYTIQETASILLPALKKNLLDAVFYSLSAETRHIYDNNNIDRLIRLAKSIGEEYENAFKNYTKQLALHQDARTTSIVRKPEVDRDLKKETENERRKSYYAALQTGTDKATFVKVMQVFFSKANWADNYGGQAWANIADAWLKLHEANTDNHMTIWIDHIYDIQHNTGSVFNKIEAYMKDRNYSWLSTALDHKAKIKDPHELIDKVSYPMKRIALRAIKAKTGKTYEQYLKDEMSSFEDVGKEFAKKYSNTPSVTLPPTSKKKMQLAFVKKFVADMAEKSKNNLRLLDYDEASNDILHKALIGLKKIGIDLYDVAELKSQINKEIEEQNKIVTLTDKDIDSDYKLPENFERILQKTIEDLNIVTPIVDGDKKRLDRIFDNVVWKGIDQMSMPGYDLLTTLANKAIENNRSRLKGEMKFNGINPTDIINNKQEFDEWTKLYCQKFAITELEASKMIKELEQEQGGDKWLYYWNRKFGQSGTPKTLAFNSNVDLFNVKNNLVKYFSEIESDSYDAMARMILKYDNVLSATTLKDKLDSICNLLENKYIITTFQQKNALEILKRRIDKQVKIDKTIKESPLYGCYFAHSPTGVELVSTTEQKMNTKKLCHKLANDPKLKIDLNLSAKTEKEVINLIESGKYILATRKIQEKSGCGLLTCKYYAILLYARHFVKNNPI